MIDNRKTIDIASKLIEIVNDDPLRPDELVLILATFIYSIGNSIEQCGDISATDVLMRYAKQPTLGVALMAQALFMKETWVHNEEKEDDNANRKDNNI